MIQVYEGSGERPPEAKPPPEPETLWLVVLGDGVWYEGEHPYGPAMCSKRERAVRLPKAIALTVAERLTTEGRPAPMLEPA